MHYYQFNIKTYQAATFHLDNDHDLAYRRLLDYYYDNEGPIANGLPWLSHRFKLPMQVIENVLHEFFVLTEKGWENSYCDRVIAEYKQYINKQRNNGRLGGRGIKRDEENNKPTANPTLTQRQANNKQETINNKQNNTTRAIALVCPQDVPEQVWKDFLALRERKKSPLTETAFKGIVREANKAGYSLKDALEVCCLRGWTGFKAEWVLKDRPSSKAASWNEAINATGDNIERDITSIAERVD